MATYNVLTMGASYGSLLATKLLFGGHRITMVCLPAEVEAFNQEGARVRPDQKVVFFDDWERPEERLKGATAILRQLVALAAHAKAA